MSVLLCGLWELHLSSLHTPLPRFLKNPRAGELVRGKCLQGPVGVTQLGSGSGALMATAGLLPGPSCPSPTHSSLSGQGHHSQAGLPAPGLSRHAAAYKAGTNSFWALLDCRWELPCYWLLSANSGPPDSCIPLSISVGLMTNRHFKLKRVQTELWSCGDLPNLLHAESSPLGS